MARIRTIKPGFFRHHALFKAERESGLPLRVAFAGLWTCADREGRFKWEPEALKLDCLPYDDVDFSRVLDVLSERGFIVRYSSDTRDARVNDASVTREYGYIPSWPKHQIINNREQNSTLPPPPDACVTDDARVNDASVTREAREKDLHKGNRNRKGKGTGREGEEEKNSVSPLRDETARSPDGDAASRRDDLISEGQTIEAPSQPIEEATDKLPPPEVDRARLFQQGLPQFMELSGKRELAARTDLGRWLRETGDNVVAVWEAIQAARRQPQPLADPVAWISAAVAERTTRREAMFERVDKILAERRATAEKHHIEQETHA